MLNNSINLEQRNGKNEQRLKKNNFYEMWEKRSEDL